jgi:hypothetical protein
MAVRFTRAKNTSPSCCVFQTLIFYSIPTSNCFLLEKNTELLSGEALFRVIHRQEPFPGEIFLKVLDHERVMWEDHG